MRGIGEIIATRTAQYGAAGSVWARLRAYHYVAIGLAFGLAFWIIDSAVDAWVFGEGHIRQQLVDPEPVELWVRLFVLSTAFWVALSFFHRRTKIEIRSKDELIASVSHELRNPLAAVVGLTALLQDAASELSPAERRDIVRMIAREGSDLTNIVEDLQVAARRDSARLQLASVPVNLGAQVSQVLEAVDERDRVEVAATAARAIGDPARVRQIVRNLVSNALRYGGPHVRIDAAHDGTEVVLIVSDDGVGIPRAEWERVFEPYHRLADYPGGMGLGLSVSRALARSMGGDLTYAYEEGTSRFALTLRAA